MKPIKSSPRKLVHENPFSKVYLAEADFGDIQKNYYITHFGPRSGIVVVRDNAVLMVHQYRFLPNEVGLEIPGGKVEDGEDPETAAIRECQEETAVVCSNLKPLVVYYPGLDNVENRTSLFYSHDVTDTGTFVPDVGEAIKTEWVPLERCVEMIFDGTIMDAFTIAGVMSYMVLQNRC